MPNKMKRRKFNDDNETVKTSNEVNNFENEANDLENEETNNFENSEEIALVDPPPLSPQNRPTGSESSEAEAVGTGNLAACPLSRIQIYYIISVYICY